MKKTLPTLPHQNCATYGWFTYFCHAGDDETAQEIYEQFYFDDAVVGFIEDNMLKDDQGKLAPSKMDKVELIDALNSYFGDDVHDLYYTNASENIEHWFEVPDKYNLGDILFPKLIPFEPVIEKVPPLPPEIVPEPIAEYIFEASKVMDNAPPEYTAAATIGALGGLLGHNVLIQPKEHSSSWLVPPNLWVALTGAPSTKKSPSINNALRPLNHAIKKILKPRNEELLRQYRADKKMFDAKKKALQKELDDAFKEGDESFAKSKADEIANLIRPQLKSRDFLIHDATQESLAKKMSENDNGILNVRDELSGWLESMNKQNQSHARAFFLEAYNGNSNYTVERIASESFTIDRTLMSVVGGIQPSKLTPLLESRQNGQSDDGLLERLIQFSVFPDNNCMEYVDEPFDDKHQERIQPIV